MGHFFFGEDFREQFIGGDFFRAVSFLECGGFVAREVEEVAKKVAYSEDDEDEGAEEGAEQQAGDGVGAPFGGEVPPCTEAFFL